jgi:hypothetical protein
LERHGVVVIASHNHVRPFAHKIDHLGWLRSVVDKIAEHPKFVVLLGQSLESLEISMNVGRDQDPGHLVLSSLLAIAKKKQRGV